MVAAAHRSCRRLERRFGGHPRARRPPAVRVRSAQGWTAWSAGPDCAIAPTRRRGASCRCSSSPVWGIRGQRVLPLCQPERCVVGGSGDVVAVPRRHCAVGGAATPRALEPAASDGRRTRCGSGRIDRLGIGGGRPEQPGFGNRTRCRSEGGFGADRPFRTLIASERPTGCGIRPISGADKPDLTRESSSRASNWPHSRTWCGNRTQSVAKRPVPAAGEGQVFWPVPAPNRRTSQPPPSASRTW